MPTNEELIKQMYDSNLASQQAQLQQDYETADSELAAAKEKNAKVTDQNLTRTAVEGQKAVMNMTELHNAQGLSSGAKAQARLSLENQTAADMTTLQAAQQEADAETERQRALLAKEYSAAIAQAQADNDLQRAQALYEQAKQAEAQLLAKQEAAAGIMAGVGDFSAYKTLYGLTDAQIAQLSGAYKSSQEAAAQEAQSAEFEKQWKIAKDMAELGDESYLNALLVAAGLKTEEPVEPDRSGYTVTNRTGNGWVAIGNSRLSNADLESAIASGQIKRVYDDTNKTVSYQYAHPGVTPNGTPVTANGNTDGAYDNIQSPQRQADGKFVVGNRTMTADELYAAVANGTVRADYNSATGSFTFTLLRGSAAGVGPSGRIEQKAVYT